MSEPAPIRYRTQNRAAYDAALRERRSSMVWVDASACGAIGKRGG